MFIYLDLAFVERSPSQPSVGLLGPNICPGDLTAVDYALHLHQLVGLDSDRIFQNLAVGTVGDLAHILHTLVTHLDVVLVDQFGGLLFRNDSMIFINSFPICVSSLHACAEWRIEPGDISRPRPVLARSRTVANIRGLELQLVVVTCTLQSLLVHRGCIKHCLTALEEILGNLSFKFFGISLRILRG